MTPSNLKDLLARQKRAEAIREKTRAVERLERSLWRWRSERNIQGSDTELFKAFEACRKAFKGTK